MTHHRPAWRAAVAALALFVAACGGGDGGDGDLDTTTTTATAAPEGDGDPDQSSPAVTDDGPAEPEEEPVDEEALALARAVNLTIDDFAGGWREDPDDDEPGAAAECFQDVDLDEVRSATADSPRFSVTAPGGAGQLVQTTAIVVTDEAAAEALMDEVGTARFAGCTEDVLRASFEEQGLDFELDLERVEAPDGLGDQAVAIAADLVVEDPDGPVQGLLALSFIRTANVASGVLLLDLGGYGFGETLEELLVTVSARHAQEIG